MSPGSPLKEKHHLLVEELPHAVKQRIPHGVVAAAHLADHFCPGYQEVLVLGQASGRINSRAIDAHVSEDDGLGFIILVAVRRRLAADLLALELGSERPRRRAAKDPIDV